MRRTAVLLLALATPLAAQSSFEGAIAMTVTSDGGKSSEVNYLVKGSKVRMEMPGGRGETMVMIFDVAEKRMVMLMAAQKMYMEQEISGPPAEAADKANAAKITRTGKFETIAGYKCEHVLVAEDGSSSDVCVAKGLGAFRMPSGGGRGGTPREPEWQAGLGDGGFPLKVQKGDKVTMEVKSIDKKTLDAALFAPPSDFRKMDMGGMMRRRP